MTGARVGQGTAVPHGTRAVTGYSATDLGITKHECRLTLSADPLNPPPTLGDCESCGIFAPLGPGLLCPLCSDLAAAIASRSAA